MFLAIFQVLCHHVKVHHEHACPPRLLILKKTWFLHFVLKWKSWKGPARFQTTGRNNILPLWTFWTYHRTIRGNQKAFFCPKMAKFFRSDFSLCPLGVFMFSISKNQLKGFTWCSTRPIYRCLRSTELSLAREDLRWDSIFTYEITNFLKI